MDTVAERQDGVLNPEGPAKEIEDCNNRIGRQQALHSMRLLGRTQSGVI